MAAIDDKNSTNSTPSLFGQNPSLNQSELTINSTEPLINTNDHLKNRKKRKNYLILFIVSLALILGPTSTTIFFPAIVNIREYFQTTELMVSVLAAVSTFILGFAPLFWGSYSDTFGQWRKSYLIAIALSMISSIICFISPNIWVLMLARASQAFGAAAVHCLGGGVISDIYAPKERGHAYGIYFFAYNIGEIGGPVIGGYLTEYLGWRFIFLFLSIFCAILFTIIFLFLPETFNHHSTNPQPFQKEMMTTRFNPLSSFKLLRYPKVSIIIVYFSSLWLTTSINYIIIPTVYSSKYQISSSTIGLIFLAPGIGFMIGSVIGGKYSDYVVSKFTMNEDDEIYPEVRLKSIWIACILAPVSFLAYGWFLDMNSKIYWSLISMFIGSFGTLFVYGILSTYLVDSYPNNSASVIALSDCVPSFTGGLCQLSSFSLQNSLGIGWMFTLLISINSLCSVLIILVYLKGRSWK